MTIGNFEHLGAGSLEEAAAAFEGKKDGASIPGGAAVFTAGGTDLLGILKDRVHKRYPARIVDLKQIPGLAFIREEGGDLSIGAMTSLADIAANPIVRGRYGLLAEAARSVASPQIRNMATIGGNICQEPRCWYYRNPDNRFDCLRKGGRACAALLGDNRFHSIFGSARVGRPSCSDECPDGIDIRAYMGLVREGDLDGAARILLDRNPIAAVTGRVCPHYCERGCNRNLFDESVSIRAVERRLGDYILENADRLYEMPKAASGKRVAVVGAGPAGLAAAFYLRKAGHEVHVFDRFPEAGGMLRYSIPAYRLPPAVLRSLIASFERAGIVFELGVEIGAEAGADATSGGRSLASLRREYDSLFLATGAWEQKSLRIEGSEVLESGIDFLATASGGGDAAAGGGDAAAGGGSHTGSATRPGTSLAGAEVVVVGGGNVAVDVAITAKRQGAKKVTMVCLEARDEMPAFPEEIEEALREGVGLLPSWGPKRALLQGGRLGGMEFVACASVFDKEGRFAPVFDEARTMKLDAARVILAIGQSAELGYLGEAIRSERGRIIVDAEDQSTGSDGIFAGGDATTGPASVIQAVAAGRRAAKSIEIAFGGSGRFVARDESAEDGEEGTRELRGIKPAVFEHSGRVVARELPLDKRCLDAEDVATLEGQAAQEEAGRCLDCSCVAVNASDMAPALLALGATIHTTRRRLDAEDFFAVRNKSTTRLMPGEIVTEIRIPPQGSGTGSAYRKFRIRKSIDFPIVSVASNISIENGTIVEARLAFGAVAPLPLRAKEVERFLVGKRPDEATAEEAAAIAVRGALPLASNGYKIQILKGLVRRAVLGKE
ncbi:MAG TPA: FAD binding domain-containing protein [Rectinemataceae bacterium]|nr:FAD binding domain-containing protein [Rectinemataceae bacterium]